MKKLLTTTLAAGLGLLMISGWLLGGRTADYAPPTQADGGTGFGSLAKPKVEKKHTPGFDKSRP